MRTVSSSLAAELIDDPVVVRKVLKTAARIDDAQ